MSKRAPLVVFAVALGLAGPVHAQEYRFPTSPEDYGAYYPTAYKDQGGEDWNCGNIYYAGHNGSDFGGGSWDGMAAGRDIVAAADGVVDYTNDGVADDCSTGDCPGGGGFGNYVKLNHADGKTTYYAHMKTWSVAVSTSDVVSCGQKLGEMGSSGFSTGPHLHFEVRVDGTAADPFDGPCSAPPSYWVDQGAHGGLPGLTCDGSEPCTPSGGLQCGVPLSGSNTGGDATNSVLSYSCTEYVYTGAEAAWAWTAAVSESVTVSMTGHSQDLDLFVLNGPGCSPSSCVAGSTNPNTDAETVTFDASAGSEYVFVVDGWEGAASSFQLEVSCTEPGDDDDATDPPVDDDDATDPPDDDDDDDSGEVIDDDDSAGLDGSPFFPEAERLGAVDFDGSACEGCGAGSVGRVLAGLFGVLAIGLGIVIRRWRY